MCVIHSVKISTQYPDDYYEWDPCKGLKCGYLKGDNHSAVSNEITKITILNLCLFLFVQVCRGEYMSLGHYLKPIFLIQQHDPLVFTIEYPDGDYYRYYTIKYSISCYNTTFSLKYINISFHGK